MTAIDERDVERSARAICIAAGYEPEQWADNDDLRNRCMKYARVALQALRPGSTGETELHGPFGYLVCPIGLDESHWRFEDDPEKDAAYVCLPVFTKEDPFERAMLAAAGGREG